MTGSPTRSGSQPPPPTGDPVPLPPPDRGTRSTSQPPAPHPAPPPPRPAPPAPRPELVKAATSSARLFLLLAICSLVMSGRPLPWAATSLLFSIPAVWVGIQALRRHRAAGSGPGSTFAMTLGVGLAAFVVGSQVLNLVLWPVQWEYEQCRAEALSVSALDRCEERRVDRLSPQQLFRPSD